MSRDHDGWSEDDLVIVDVKPLGGFRPTFCALCGSWLRTHAHVYCEGTVCARCNSVLPTHVLHGAGEFRHREGGAS